MDGFEVSLTRVSQDASFYEEDYSFEGEYALEHTSRALYVSNIPKSATKGHLINIFKFAGWIDDIQFCRGNYSVVIYFQEPEAVDFLMFECDLSRFVLSGHQLYLERL